MDMSTSASRDNLFSLLPETRTPWTEFFFGTGMQALAVALLSEPSLDHRLESRPVPETE